MTQISAPDGWSHIDTEFGQQIDAFQRQTDGLVVSIERGTTGHKYAVSFLPENFPQDNQAIQSYGDDGYLYTGESEDAAFEEAEDWMQDNS